MPSDLDHRDILLVTHAAFGPCFDVDPTNTAWPEILVAFAFLLAMRVAEVRRKDRTHRPWGRSGTDSGSEVRTMELSLTEKERKSRKGRMNPSSS